MCNYPNINVYSTRLSVLKLMEKRGILLHTSLSFQILLNDDAFKMWEPLPYCWFAFHWLAMSHSCYNPIIYCYMNARFRGGFLQIIYRVPGLRRCCCLRRYLHNRGERNYDATGEMTFKFIAGNGGGLLRKPKIRIRCHAILVFSVLYCLSLLSCCTLSFLTLSLF